MTKLLHLLVFAVVGLATRDVILLAVSQVPNAHLLTVPTARLCVLCDFGATAASPSLYSVQGSTIGIGLLAEGADGDLYGTSPVGGAVGVGTVFKVTRSGQLTSLHSFNASWGAQPESGLIAEQGSDGKPTGTFFGTTLMGGVVQAKNRNSGTVFSVRTGATGGASMNVLYNFRNGSLEGLPKRYCPTPTTCGYDAQAILDAAASYPNSAPVIGGDGNLYGIAPVGQTNFGVLYRIPKGGGDDKFTTLCAGGTLLHGTTMPFPQLQAMCMLTGVSKNYPTSLVAGAGNMLYGTLVGGTAANPHGMVFQATSNGRVSIIHKFSGTDGSAPFSVIQATDSFLYGTTFRGGAASAGVVFSLTRAGGLWAFKTLLDFGTEDTFGTNPAAGVLDVPDVPGPASGGYLYGVTKGGVGLSSNGIIFRIRRDGTNFKLLQTFPNDPRSGAITFPQGRMPVAPLLVHSDGNFYGATTLGGAKNVGVLYRLNGVNLQMTNAPSPFITIVPGKLVSDPDQYVEVRANEASGQLNPACDPKHKLGPMGVCVVPGWSDYQIRIDVKNCRNPHVVQFVRRREEFIAPSSPAIADPAGSTEACKMGANRHVNYPLGAWHTDADCGKPNPYIDQNPGSARAYGPYVNAGATPVAGAFSMTIWDQPTLSNIAQIRSRADFKDFVICNCSVVRQVNWSRVQVGTQPPTYTEVSIVVPTQFEIGAMNSQLTLDGFDPVLTVQRFPSAVQPGSLEPLQAAGPLQRMFGLQRSLTK